MDSSHPTTPDEEKKSLDASPPEVLYDDLEKHAIDFSSEMKGMDFVEVAEAATHLTLEEAKAIIHDAIDGHEADPNFDQNLLRRAQAALKSADLSHDVARDLVEEIKLEAALMDDSPYAEVRASVDNTDDYEMSVNTFRSWFLGMLFTIVGTGINTFFAARNPSISVNTFCAQVLAFPMAKAMEWALPTTSVTLFGKNWSLNPGKFSVKEHMLISIMANVTFGGGIGVYSTDIVFVQRLPQFFNQNVLGSNAGYQLLLTISTQLIGFSMAGLTRRFLVYPPAMIWPSNLATIVLNRSFHQDTNPIAHGWKISRLRFFTIVFFAYGMYFVLPDAIASFLTYFNWMTWIAPDNVKLAIFTGSITGLGISPITTFDWSYLSALNNPLITPLFSTYNLYGGAVVIGLIGIPSLYFSNTWNTAYLPINSNHIFSNTGHRFNVSRILNEDFSLNPEKYAAYSGVYQSAGNAVVFFAFFACYTSIVVQIILYYRPEVVGGFRAVINRTNARDAYKDVHNRLMKRYPEVPEWWFACILAISLIFGITANEVYHTQMPIWAILFSAGLGGLFLVPVGIITAVTNIEITTNVIAEVIGGYILPGKPLAVMIFKTYGFISCAQGIGYAGDMKLGHYVKIPPRTLFFAQLSASLVACFVGLGVAGFQINTIEGLCGAAQVSGFTCPGYNTFFSSAVQWGAIGPARLYSEGRIYYPLVYGFLFGAVTPLIPWYFTRRYPNSIWKFVSAPVIWTGALNWAPYNLSYLTPSIPIAYYFMGYLRTHKVAWWNKYNYVLATALTASISIFGVIWFFAILYNNFEPDWWGNNISFNGCDATGCRLLDIPDVGYFGPTPAGL